MIVIVESPYAGNIEINLRYARAAMRHCLLQGHAPFASHALYTQDGVLNDLDPDERRRGIEAGFQLRGVADYTIFFVDLGWSRGMLLGREDCVKRGLPYCEQSLGEWRQYVARMAAYSNATEPLPEAP